MNNRRSRIVGLMFVIAVIFPMVVWTDKVDAAPADVIVQFGYPQPQPGGAANNVVVPEEVFVHKGGTVTFLVNGGGHGIAIYPVSKKTVREDIAEDLCQAGCDATTAGNQYLVTDRKGNVIIDSGTNPPSNRVNDPLDRLLSAGDGAFLVGSTPTTEGTQIQYRFQKKGRFLAICTNRGHFLNDKMFGFINVVGGDLD